MIPPGVAYVNSVESLSFESEERLLQALAQWISLPFDYLAKVSGNDDVRESYLRVLPWANVPDVAIHRALQLSCLTSHYSPLCPAPYASSRIDTAQGDGELAHEPRPLISLRQIRLAKSDGIRRCPFPRVASVHDTSIGRATTRR